MWFIKFRAKTVKCISYVGPNTGRKLGTRIFEHRNHIKSNNRNQLVITEHQLGFNYRFRLGECTILDRERFLNKWLNSEMSHIYMQKNGLNLKTDTECLHHSCLLIECVLNKIDIWIYYITGALSYIYFQRLLSSCHSVTFNFKWHVIHTLYIREIIFRKTIYI